MKCSDIQSLFNAIEYYYESNYCCVNNELRIFSFEFHSRSSHSELSKKDLIRLFFFLEKWQTTQARTICVNLAIESLKVLED